MADKSQNTATKGGMDNVIPQTPSWFIFLRYGQFGLNFVVLICAAVSLGAFGKLGPDYFLGWGPGFAVFTSVYVLIFLAAIIAIPIYAPQFYYKWFALGAECFAVLWTLSSFAGLAEWAAAFGFIVGTNDEWQSVVDTIHGATSAGAAFGAFLWVSFIVSLVFHSIACHRARIAKKSWNNPGNAEAQLGPVGTSNPQQAYDPAPQPAGYGYQQQGQPQYHQ